MLNATYSRYCFHNFSRTANNQLLPSMQPIKLSTITKKWLLRKLEKPFNDDTHQFTDSITNIKKTADNSFHSIDDHIFWLT